MNTTDVEQLLVAAFADARTSVSENPDLFARVTRSLDDQQARRRFRWRLARWILAFVAANALLALALSDFDNRRFVMPWWVIELITNIVLVALAIGLGPFIKRFGRSYAADVFRANPRTGKSYLVLTDVAYYLIFAAFVLFTVTFVEHASWRRSTGEQLQHEAARIGGILLIMGVLHAANVIALPVIGRLLSSNKRLDESGVAPAAGMPPSMSVPPLGPGTWILRIEPAPGALPADPAS
ncbi:MAG: hypothetical protein Q7V88_12315 [Actinomycetota bacterium]|nr:hypothetical protein [Actinomycetota bacterium]